MRWFLSLDLWPAAKLKFEWIFSETVSESLIKRSFTNCTAELFLSSETFFVETTPTYVP